MKLSNVMVEQVVSQVAGEDVLPLVKALNSIEKKHPEFFKK